jgi:outer membrane protein
MYKIVGGYKMKKRLIVTLLAVFVISMVSAQKYAYVDSDYILENIPEYKDAQNQLDELAEEYQKEIEGKFVEIDKLYKTYQAEVVLMPEDVKKKREQEITAKEKEVKDLQTLRFGKEGDLFLKREELIKPIQEKIYNAIEEIATEKNYAFVFDKAGSLTILFVSSKFDISDDVLDNVGAVLGTVRKEDRQRKEYQPSTGTTPKQDNKNQQNPENVNRMNNPQKPGGEGPGPVNKGEKK